MADIKKGNKTKEKIKTFIIHYIEKHGYPPTVREISEGTGLKSTSSVYTYLTKLITDGELETDAGIGSARAIRVPGYIFVKVEDVGLGKEWSDKEDRNDNSSNQKEMA